MFVIFHFFPIFHEHLCHSKTRMHDITLSPYTSFNSWKHSVRVLFQFHKKFQIDCDAWFSS
jgi:hypothetical protein